MVRRIPVIVLVFVFLPYFSQALAEVGVSNVTAAQQPGTKLVTITYDVSSTATDTVDVSVEVTDSGMPVAATSLSGDVGSGVSTGTGKTIVWDAGADWNEQFSSNISVTVVADDGVSTVQPGNDFVYVAAGTDAGNNVTINEPFYMSKYECTNQQMADVMQWAYDQGLITASVDTVENADGATQELLNLDDSDSQISYSGGTFSVDSGKGAYPCVEVTWYGAVAYCNYLSEQEGLTPAYDLSDWSLDVSADGYRLPGEDQWEYAARGGKDGSDTEYSGSDILDEVGWYWENSDASGNSNFYSGKGSMPVGQKAANELGIYDMSGNVWEWCQEWLEDNVGSYRVLRGGSWRRNASLFRVSNRSSYSPDGSNSNFGFRPLVPAGQ